MGITSYGAEYASDLSGVYISVSTLYCRILTYSNWKISPINYHIELQTNIFQMHEKYEKEIKFCKIS